MTVDQLGLLAPDPPVDNDDRVLEWAIRMLQFIADQLGWELTEYLPGAWRVRLPRLGYDIPLGDTRGAIILSARKYYASYKELCIDDPEKILKYHS